MTELRSIRPLPAASMRGIAPSPSVGKAPKIEWVDPREIYVEDAYQRSLSGETSTTLIRRIVANFDWSRFKPPICVRLPASGNVLVCIDGQHTATAAATHPSVPKIPVLVVAAESVATRAESFVGHNKDRIALTPMAIYRAELAAGNQVAQAIERACKASGAEILNSSVNLREATPPGKTIAVGTLRSVVRKDGEAFLARVLTLLMRAERGPVKAGEIAAVAALLRKRPEGEIDAKLRAVVASRTTEKWGALAATLSADEGGTAVDALVTLWARELDVRVGKDKPPERPVPASPPARPAAEPRARAPEPAPPPPAPAHEAPKPPLDVDGAPGAKRFVEFNGVQFDLLKRTVQNRGKIVRLSDEGLRLVAALARVKPALLPAETAAKRAVNRVADADRVVRSLAAALNPTLSGIALEVREVKKMGFVLADLGD